MSKNYKKVIAVTFVANAVYNTNRLFKLSNFIVEKTKIDKITILGFWEKSLKRKQIYSDKVEIKRIKSFHQFFNISSHFIKKIVIIISILPLYITFIFRAISHRPKFIFCHDVFFLPASLFVKFISGSYLFYMPHELETEEDGLGKIQKKVFKLFESLAFPLIDHTIVVSDDIMKWYSEHYKVKSIAVIRNIPDFEYIDTSPKLLRSTLGIEKHSIVFIYQGLIDVSRGINTLIESFILVDDKNKHLVFMGYGPAAILVQKASLVNKNIHYLDAVPAEQIISYTSDADIGVTFIPGDDLTLSYKFSLSNKLFEYLKCRVPVLCSDNLLSISNLVSENSSGWILKSNLDSLSEFIKRVDKKEIQNLDNALMTVSLKLNWENEVLILKSKIDDCNS